jgi:transposase-like protein
MGETNDRAEALRLKLASSRDSRKRVSQELRREAVAFSKAEHALGRRYKPIAKALGVKAETLMRWCRASRDTKRAKVPHFDATGLIVWAKRLERGRDDRVCKRCRRFLWQAQDASSCHVRRSPRPHAPTPAQDSRHVALSLQALAERGQL